MDIAIKKGEILEQAKIKAACTTTDTTKMINLCVSDEENPKTTENCLFRLQICLFGIKLRENESLVYSCFFFHHSHLA